MRPCQEGRREDIFPTVGISSAPGEGVLIYDFDVAIELDPAAAQQLLDALPRHIENARPVAVGAAPGLRPGG